MLQLYSHERAFGTKVAPFDDLGRVFTGPVAHYHGSALNATPYTKKLNTTFTFHPF
jgi:hypothetical protein